METKFSLSINSSQMTDLCKKQARKTTKPLLIMAIGFLCFCVLLVVLNFFIEKDYSGYIAVFFFLDLFFWLMVILIRCSAPKNAENFFKYYSVDGVVTYGYELCETEFIVTQPAIGNVSHYKYEMIQRVNEYADCVAVMLVTNQFLPIIVNEQTAPLIATLKSVAGVKK